MPEVSQEVERIKGGNTEFSRGQRWSVGVYCLATRSSPPEQLKQSIDFNWKGIAIAKKRRSKSFHLILKKNMNVILPQYAYNHPQQLPLYFNSYLSGKLFCLALQSSFKPNERWVSKPVGWPVRQWLSNKADHVQTCLLMLMLQCFS